MYWQQRRSMWPRPARVFRRVRLHPGHEVAALRALLKTKTGARCMASPMTVHVTPPDILRIFMPGYSWR